MKITAQLKQNIPLAIILVACIGILLYQPLIFRFDNIANILKQASLIGIFALAQSVVLITKGLDLSQGGVITLVSVSVALLCAPLGLPLAICMGVVIGCVLGLANGMIISFLNVSPFVVTLGSGFLLQGVALVLSKGQPIYNLPEGYSYLGWGEFLGLPIIVYILLFLSLVLYIYLKRMIAGRYLFAIGSNEHAARLTGINVNRHKVIAYTICGMLTAVGAIVLSSRINSGHPVEGFNTALQAVAAAVIGGVSLFGGRGTIMGVLLGALLLAFISNALNIMNISSYYQQIMIGGIIIIAIIIDKLRTQK